VASDQIANDAIENLEVAKEKAARAVLHNNNAIKRMAENAIKRANHAFIFAEEGKIEIITKFPIIVGIN